MSTEYVDWFPGKGEYMEGKGSEYPNSPVILGLEIPSVMPSHDARRNRREGADARRAASGPAQGPSWGDPDDPGPSQEGPGKGGNASACIMFSEEIPDRALVSSKKTKHPHTEKARVL